MPEPIRCAECGESTHSAYSADTWQIRRDVVSVFPDGTTTSVTPYSVVACSRKCAASLLMREEPNRG